MGTGAPNSSGRDEDVRPHSTTPGQDGSRQTPAPASPTQSEIRASDLVSLMAVVEAAVALYNRLETFDPATVPWEVLIPPFNALGSALDDLGLEQG